MSGTTSTRTPRSLQARLLVTVLVLVVNGRAEPVPVDKAELRKISDLSGGKAFTAGSAAELETVYTTIAHQIGYEKQYTEITERFAGGALVLAVLAALAVMSLAASWP